MSRWRLVRTFLEKERLDVGSRKLVLSIYFFLPLLLSLLPLAVALGLGAAAARHPAGESPLLAALFRAAAAVPDLQGLAPEDAVTVLLLRQMSALLVLVPIVLTTFTGSYSIVGEKTERTLEPLLATPLSDAEILTGKLGALGLPALLATLAAGSAAAAVADLVLLPRFGRLVLPDGRWLFTALVLVPLATLLGLLITLHVSSRSTDPQSAQQVSGLLAVPVVLGLLSAFVHPALAAWSLGLLGIALAIADAALFAWTLRRFNREQILTRWR